MSRKTRELLELNDKQRAAYYCIRDNNSNLSHEDAIKEAKTTKIEYVYRAKK